MYGLMKKTHWILAGSMVLMIITGASNVAQSSHMPTEPNIELNKGTVGNYKMLGYKVMVGTGVPIVYKDTAASAVKSWQHALEKEAPSGSWRFVWDKDYPQFVIHLLYDKATSSPYCRNADVESTAHDDYDQEELEMGLAPIKMPRRISTWQIYVGCGDTLFDPLQVRLITAHSIGHGLGLGPARGDAEAIMCDKLPESCTLPENGLPTELDVHCVLHIYNSDGFENAKRHFRDRFCTLESPVQ